MPTMFEETETSPLQPVSVRDRQPVKLAMQQLLLTGRALPAGARLLVRHTFAAAGRKPVEAVYPFQLPRDAALRRFRITGPGFSARSELRPVSEAGELYEQGVERGHLAALARVYRDGLVNLSVGNLRPGEPVTVWLEILAGVDSRDDGFRFRYPFTLAPSYHLRARAIAPNGSTGEIELPEDEFDDLLLPPFRTDARDLHEIGFELSLGAAGADFEVSSPSHPVRVRVSARGARVGLSAAGDIPNRDLILDVKNRDRSEEIRSFSGRGADGRTHFAAIVPSTFFGAARRAARSVVFVLDRSGSMSGAPIHHARQALAACLAALSEQDYFALAAFDDRVETFRRELVPATMANRESARQWLAGVDARGGTELGMALQAAARILQGGAADLFVFTDGQVFATEDVLAAAAKTGARVHTLGLGAASQDRFLALLARRTGGVSRFVSLRERTDTAALDLFASVAAPVARQLQITEEAIPGAALEPEPPADVFAGSPVVLYGSADGASAGLLRFQWERDNGPLIKTSALELSDSPDGETLRLLRGARLIAGAESELGASSGERQLDHRRRGRLDHRLEALSREYGLASRAMSLVAVVQRPDESPGDIPETQVIPTGLPEGMELGGVFSGATLASAHRLMAQSIQPQAAPYSEASCPGVERHARPSAWEAELADDSGLTELAARLEPDGGMPGRTIEQRILASLCAILAFAAGGSTTAEGPYRLHVRRLADFIEANLPAALSPEQVRILRLALEAAGRGQVSDEDWPALALAPPADIWEKLA